MQRQRFAWSKRHPKKNACCWFGISTPHVKHTDTKRKTKTLFINQPKFVSYFFGPHLILHAPQSWRLSLIPILSHHFFFYFGFLLWLLCQIKTILTFLMFHILDNTRRDKILEVEILTRCSHIKYMKKLFSS